MKIYSFPTFNLTKVLLTAEELDLDYDLSMLDVSQAEHKSPEHMQRHPLGKVPAIEIDGAHYIESNSICRLLAEKNDNKLYGNSPEQNARINQWMDLMALHIGRWLSVLFFEESIKPNLLGGEPQQGAIDEAKGFLEQQLPVMDKALAENKFLCGDALTIADIVAFSYCQTHEYTSASFASYPHIEVWYKAVKSRSSFERAMARVPNGKMFPFSIK